MELKKILSIAGKPGLYKLIGEAKNNIIVESLIDGKKQPAFAHERISSLQEISIYTETGDTPLEEVLKKLYELHRGKKVEGVKKMSGDQLKSLFEEAVPDYDKDAVYVSDMKKVFTWYNILTEKNLLDFSETEEKSTEEEKSEEKAQPETPGKTEEPDKN